MSSSSTPDRRRRVDLTLRMGVLVVMFLLAETPSAAALERMVADATEFRAAVRAAQPGDVIVMEDGEWRDVDLLLDCSGGPDAKVTLRGRTPGGAIITGDSRLRIGGAHLVVEGLWFDRVSSVEDVIQFRKDSRTHAQHARLTQCALTDCNPPDLDEDTKWISLYGADNRVDHCRIEGKRNAGTTLVVWLSDQPNRHQIDHNFFGPRPRLGKNGGETIRVGTSDWSLHESETVVEHNVFERCNGEVEIISSKSCGNVYRWNLFLQCEGALTLRHGNRCTVEGNVFLGGGERNTGGVRIVGEDHRVFNNYFAGLRGDRSRAAVSCMMGIPDGPLNGYAQVRRAAVVFNTFVDCDHPFAIGVEGGDDATLEPTEVTIESNILLDLGRTRLQLPAAGASAAMNLLEGGGQADPPLPSGFRPAELRLERGAGGLLRPTAASDTVDAGGTELEFMIDDIDGETRGSRPDAGCDEWSQGPQRARVFREESIGPDWNRWTPAAEGDR